MTVDDAYAELGLTRDADLAQAKAAWRALVSRWHPDRNGHHGASARMQRINLALQRIRGAAGPDPGVPPAAAEPPPAPVPPRTVERRVRLTLEEAAAGCVKLMRGSVVDACGSCAGSGEAPEPVDCAACAGQGTLRQRAWFGWYASALACAACDGRGVLRHACAACEGRGKTEVARYRVSVRLPPGVRDGDLLHVPPGRAGGQVALALQVRLLPHAVLMHDGDGTLRCELPVDGFAWIAARTVDVPTLQGPLPLGLKRGQVVYRLPGLGMPARGGGARAEQIVIVTPRFPERLTREQQRLLDRLVASTAGDRAG